MTGMWFRIGVFFCLLASPSQAAEHVLYEIALDVNRNGVPDRAMLVIVGDQLNIREATPLYFYMLEDGQRGDLLVFLDVGDDAVNVTDEASFRKQGIVTSEGLRFAMPLQANAKGSLNVVTSNGFGNTFNTTETLSIVFRDKAFRIAGWAQDFYNSREDQSAHCSVNYLSGKAVKRKNDGKDSALKGKFTSALLADWSDETRPTVCNE